MKHFRMELDSIELSVLAGRSSHRAIRSVGNYIKARSHLADVVKMAHPYNCLLLDSCKQAVKRAVDKGLCLAVLTDRSLLNFAAKHMHHELSPVAKPKNRNPQFKELSGI